VFRVLKKPKLEKTSSERSLAMLALNRPPEPSPVKRRTDTSGPPIFQVHKFDPPSEISSPPRTPICGGLRSSKPHSTETKAKDDEVLRQVPCPIDSFLAD
jgi:hypothetical protein